MNNYLISSLLLMSTILFSSIDAQTECIETRGCEGQTLSNRWVDCYGYHSCANADITSSEVYSWSYGTYEADVASSLVFAYGNSAGYSATIKASTVYSYGYRSTSYADIYPLNSDLVVYFYGYFAGNGASVTCDSGETCTIYCKSNGCYNTDFYCYSDADCNVVCSEEDADNCPTQIGEGGDESSDLTLADVQIKAIYNRKVAEKKKRMKAEKEGNKFDGIALDAHPSEKKHFSFALENLISALTGALMAAWIFFILAIVAMEDKSNMQS